MSRLENELRDLLADATDDAISRALATLPTAILDKLNAFAFAEHQDRFYFADEKPLPLLERNVA